MLGVAAILGIVALVALRVRKRRRNELPIDDHNVGERLQTFENVSSPLIPVVKATQDISRPAPQLDHSASPAPVESVPPSKSIYRDQSSVLHTSVQLSSEDEALWAKVTADLTESQMNWMDFDLKVRFIRGSAFLENPKKREAYLKKRLIDTCSFREKFRIDSILNRGFPFTEEFRNDCWRMKIYGNDDDGNPIVYVPLAQHAYRSVKQGPYISNILEYLAYHQEALLLAVRRRSVRRKEIVQPQYTAVFDLNGFGWRHFKEAYECGFFSEVAELWAVNYPETMRRIYVINAPFVITAIMKFVSAFIEPDTLLKLRILGHSFMPKFESDHVPLSSLPREIGGTGEGVWILPPENPKLNFD